MRNQPPNINLPSLPSFMGSKEFAQIERMLRESGSLDAKEWSKIVGQYLVWEDSVAGKHTSNLNRKLVLYEMLVSTFSNLASLKTTAFIDLILSTVKKPGENVSFRAPDGRTIDAKIVRRTITDRLGILMTVQKADGEIFEHEIFE